MSSRFKKKIVPKGGLRRHHGVTINPLQPAQAEPGADAAAKETSPAKKKGNNGGGRRKLAQLQIPPVPAVQVVDGEELFYGERLIDIEAAPDVRFTLGTNVKPVGMVVKEMNGYIAVPTLLRTLGSLGAPVEESAAVFGVSKRSFLRFLKREPLARSIYEDGHLIGNVTLRGKQNELATRSATMAIFLGMQRLGQVDKRFLGLKGELDMTVSPLGKLLSELDAGGYGKTINHDPGEVAKGGENAVETKVPGGRYDDSDI